MDYTFTHSISFKDVPATLPYRSTCWWKTVKGAQKAAEKHAEGMASYYQPGSITCHSLVIWDRDGTFITNEAA